MTDAMGHEERVSFFAEQARLRKRTWQISALGVLSAVVMGLPLSIIITPLFYFFVIGILKLLSLLILFPAALWDALKMIFKIAPSAIQTVLDAKGFLHLRLGLLLETAALYLLPGMITMFLLWHNMRSLFMKAGPGGMLLYLGARKPHPEDLDERQLINIVDEMSISAGIMPPQVMLLDSDVPNAAIIGSSKDNAVIIVTRRLLDDLNREQTQGVIAHMMASAGNGDLKIGISILSLFQTLGLLSSIVDTFLGLSPSARKDLFHTLRWMRAGSDAPDTADAVAAMLTRSTNDLREDDLTTIMNKPRVGEKPRGIGLWMRRIPPLRVLMIPFLIGYGITLVIRMEIYLFHTFLMGPLTMLIWRTRRYLADAMAVQLTRNPDSLARSLEFLSEKGSVVPGGRWASYLFIVGTEAARYRTYREIRAEIDDARKETAPKSEVERMISDQVISQRIGRRYVKNLVKIDKGTLSEELGGVVPSHPPITKRLARLRLMGANVTGHYLHRKKTLGKPMEFLLLILLSPMILLGLLFFLSAFVMIYAASAILAILLSGLAMAIIGFLLL
jgi:Zn-dependent protease with chaperone function